MLHHDNAPAQASLLIREFLMKHEMTVVTQPHYSHDFEVKILTKRSPISDCRGDRRKFNKGPSRHPTKHIAGRVPELEKKIGHGVSRVEGSTLKETSLIKL